MNMKSFSHVLDALARDYVPDDINLSPRITAKIEKSRDSKMRPRTKIALAVLLVFLAFLVVLISVPGVVNAMKRLFGYIPGVGIVELGEPIRVLAEPVIVTRAGVTVGVTQATITGDKTSIVIQVVGVPSSAYPQREDIAGCMESEYLRLPDGTRLDVYANMPPLPADVNEATLVLPCIVHTLPGTVPENWELPLHFVPAPPEMTVMPVIEILPSLSPEANTPVAPENPLSITKVLEIGDSFVIMGEFRYDILGKFAHDNVQTDGSWWVLMAFKIVDANGQDIFYTFPPNEIDLPSPSRPGAETWAYQIDKYFVPPMKFIYTGQHILLANPQETVEIEFDAGNNPQPGQEWLLNKDFEMAGHKIRLVSIMADSRGGYGFSFESDPGVSGVSVDIEGYTPNGGGGGGGPATNKKEWHVVLSYAELPKGKLKVVFSKLYLVGESNSWQIQWSPDATQTGPFVTPTPQPGVCLTRDTLSQLAPAPANLSGKVLLYELLADGQNWGLTLANLDGSEKQVLVPQGSWGAFSPDGTRMAYPGPDGINIMDIATGAVMVLKGVDGYNLHWSPDGAQIEFVGGGDLTGVFVIATDGTPPRQMTTQGYEAVAGWSPDGAQIYITAQDIGGWMLRAIDVATGTARNLFILENASVKAPDATISPDGKWVAYRDRTLSSLYLVRTDGTEAHMVIDKLSAGVSGGVWSQDGKWLGISLVNYNSEERTLVLFQPESCRAFLLPALHGELEGLFLP